MAAGIRLATEGDIPAVTAIYNQAITLGNATAHTQAVSTAERQSWLADHNPDTDPVFVAESANMVTGYCSLSAYRPGRAALRHTKEISYFVDEGHRRQGVGSGLIQHALQECPTRDIRTLFAILLDNNPASAALLEKFGFERWGHMPAVADFNGTEIGHSYYGLKVAAPKETEARHR